MSEIFPSDSGGLLGRQPPLQPPGADIRHPFKLVAAAAGLVAAISLQGDAHSAVDGPSYVAEQAVSSGESPVCTTMTSQGPIISFDCLHQAFPQSLSNAARSIVRATVTVNLHYPRNQFDGDPDASTTATKVSENEAITAGHLLPTNPIEKYRAASGIGYVWLGNFCGSTSDLQGDQMYQGKRGFRARLNWIWDSFHADLKRAASRDIRQLEVASDPDVAVVDVAPNKTFATLPSVSFIGNPSQVLKVGDELLVSSDQPNGNGDMRGEVGSRPALAEPDAIEAVYLGQNRLNPTTFLVLTGIGSETQLPGEPTATTGGASGSTVMLANGSKGVGLLVGGQHDDDNKPVATSGQMVLKETGVRVVDTYGNLVKHAYLDLVQAVPSAKQMASAAIRGCEY